MLQNKDFLDKLILRIKKKEFISPFLFLGGNLELLNSSVSEIGKSLLNELEIPAIYLYKLEDNGENIKIKDIKEFLQPSLSKPSHGIQIFLIENISRMTLATSNSCLKFFEEPELGNIIFLTNKSESQVLDTVLSRVHIQRLSSGSSLVQDNFYYSLIEGYVERGSSEILSYFFKNKVEKDDIIKFLNNIILYSKNNFVFIDDLEELHDDINSIVTNNVSAKYIADKWIIKIKEK